MATMPLHRKIKWSLFLHVLLCYKDIAIVIAIVLILPSLDCVPRKNSSSSFPPQLIFFDTVAITLPLTEFDRASASDSPSHAHKEITSMDPDEKQHYSYDWLLIKLSILLRAPFIPYSMFLNPHVQLLPIHQHSASHQPYPKQQHRHRAPNL